METNLTKFLIIFLCGLVETWLYAWYLLSINKHKAIRSSLVLIIQMAVYLAIIAYVIKDMNTFRLIGIYCLGCGLGNFLKVKCDNVQIIIRKKRLKKDEKIYPKKLH